MDTFPINTLSVSIIPLHPPPEIAFCIHIRSLKGNYIPKALEQAFLLASLVSQHPGQIAWFDSLAFNYNL